MLGLKSFAIARSMPIFMLAPIANFNFASRYAMHRIIADR